MNDTAECPCGKTVRVNKDGSLRKHTCRAPVQDRAVEVMRAAMAAAPPAHSDQTPAVNYPGEEPVFHRGASIDPFVAPAPAAPAADAPARDESEKGPWFGARFPGLCAACDSPIKEGDMIRADGDGGYECEAFCGQDDPACPPHVYQDADDGNGHSGSFCTVCGEPEPERGGAWTARPSTVQAPPPDLFVPPSAPAQVAQVERDGMGRYIIKDPGLGDYRRTKGEGKPKGVTRVTTFVKAATDSKALNDWGKRNVLIGAAKRPDIAARAHGLTHEGSRDRLDEIVEELSKEAGAKISAQQGTDIHTWTERMDQGRATLDDVPPVYRRYVQLYQECLEANGLEVVPGLIERTTFVGDYGGVAGTFDRVYYHRNTGRYLIGDVKSGKTLDYGQNEIDAQLYLYATGFNRHGVFDWQTKTWDPRPFGDRPPFTVSLYTGVIIHTPLQGPDAGTVRAMHADLQNGREYADLCASVRGFKRRKPGPFDPGTPAFTERTSGEWEARFRGVQTQEEARELYDQAYVSGVLASDLMVYVELARAALAHRPA